MPSKFPKLAEDGSFRVAAYFSAPPNFDRSTLQNWLEHWVQANDTWEAFGETHRFGEYFQTVPSVSDSDELAIVFTGSPGTPKFWKDWFVRMIGSAQKEFPALGELMHVRDE